MYPPPDLLHGGEEMSKKKVLELAFVGYDSHNRPVYKDQMDRLWKDASMGACPIKNLYTSHNNYFDGEPETPMRYMSRYQDAEVVFEECVKFAA